MSDIYKAQRICIVGSGISGLTCAYLLHRYGGHKITLIEKAARLGGHTATIDVNVDGIDYAIDTGFIVFNDWTYPNFIRLLDELRVESQPTEMSFSVRCDSTGLEYSGSNLSTLFAQRRNIFNLPFLHMLKSILRFNQRVVADLDSGKISEQATLGEYLSANGYTGLFVSHYLIPMCAAIWSASFAAVLNFPVVFFVRFFKNHGLLSVNKRPQWRVIRGGSKQYIAPLIEGFKDQIKVGCTIKSVKRSKEGVTVLYDNGGVDTFDHIVFACHSDQALPLLEDITPEEQRVLGAIPYENNEVILHTDSSLLPKNRRAWAAWNYGLVPGFEAKALLTYNMNILQGIQLAQTFCVSLNASAQLLKESQVIGKFTYSHPIFSLQSLRAQQQWHHICGNNNTWFCGAYWGNGFHEDGVNSAVRVCQGLGVDW